jgi:hypothetical protein
MMKLGPRTGLGLRSTAYEAAALPLSREMGAVPPEHSDAPYVDLL